MAAPVASYPILAILFRGGDGLSSQPHSNRSGEALRGPGAPHPIALQTMASISCILFWAAVPLLIVLAVVAWFLETDRDRARRWHRSGVSQRRIADRLGRSRWQVRQLLT